MAGGIDLGLQTLAGADQQGADAAAQRAGPGTRADRVEFLRFKDGLQALFMPLADQQRHLLGDYCSNDTMHTDFLSTLVPDERVKTH
ncbi:MAG: hypothetical protein IPK19_13370 [Chloroflexi bacterium]|nr:hypothetical protein [Chloroflexota bacterium]